MESYPEQTNRFNPNILTPEQVRGLSISETTERYGSLGLYHKVQDSLERNGISDNPYVDWSLHFALAIHADDRRTNGHYADHVMRVGLRIMDRFGINDPDIVSAGFMHDTVEDHPRDIIMVLGGEPPEKAPQAGALFLLRDYLPEQTVQLISKLSFVESSQSTLSKHQQYLAYAEDIVLNHPKARVIKLSDFIDNAVGNHYTNGKKRLELDEKYLPLYRLHLSGLYMPDSLIPPEKRETIASSLVKGQFRSLGRLALAN